MTTENNTHFCDNPNCVNHTIMVPNYRALFKQPDGTELERAKYLTRANHVISLCSCCYNAVLFVKEA